VIAPPVSNIGLGFFSVLFAQLFSLSEAISLLSAGIPDRNRNPLLSTNLVDGARQQLLKTGGLRQWKAGGGAADKHILFYPGNPGVRQAYLRRAIS